MEKLDTLLDQAAEALIAGDFAALTRLTPQIEGHNLANIDRPTAETLRAKALRNARLLDAATRGVTAARLRMAEIASGPTLTTYDARGQKALLSVVSELRSHRV